MDKKTYNNKYLMQRDSEPVELTYAEVAEAREKRNGAFKEKQVGGNHYSKLVIQPVDYIVENKIPYREANAIKYITRHASKNGAQDIEKAIHYLEMILKDYK